MLTSTAPPTSWWPRSSLICSNGALDQERRVAVDDRAHALLRHPGRDADHQLLADADVDHALGVPVARAGRLEAVDADVGEHDGEPRDRSSSASDGDAR